MLRMTDLQRDAARRAFRTRAPGVRDPGSDLQRENARPVKLVSVNVSLPKLVVHDGGLVSTGIFKEPAAGRVRMRTLNLDGDRQADLRVHGGPHKAVYAYPVEHYDHWRGELGRDDLRDGQFGENLTVQGLLEDEVYVGDVLRVGRAVVQVSQPRTPCFKLGIRMGTQTFLKPFLRSGRVGFYLRVLEEGDVGAGDAIERVHPDPERLSIREVSRIMYLDPDDLEGARRALRVAALSPTWRDSFAERLAAAREGAVGPA
jgi:MOSC domain-containing protein YiiM